MESIEPRDKVFALRSLFPSSLGTISIDYNAPVAQVYTEATRETILLHEPNLLAFKLPQPTTSKMLLPSWVPDLPYKMSSLDISLGQATELYRQFSTRAPFCCSSSSKPAIKCTADPTEIVVRGCCVDILESYCNQFTRSERGKPEEWYKAVKEDLKDPALGTLRHCIGSMFRNATSRPRKELNSTAWSVFELCVVDKSEQLEEFVQILMAESDTCGISAEELDSIVNEIRRGTHQDNHALEEALRQPESNGLISKIRTVLLDRKWRCILADLYHFFLANAFVTTQANRFGSADALVAKGDCVFLFCGADVP
jgi:hypothetical protein